ADDVRRVDHSIVTALASGTAKPPETAKKRRRYSLYSALSSRAVSRPGNDSAAIRECTHAVHARADHKQSAGRGLLLQFVVAKSGACTGDVEVTEVFAAEGARSNPLCRKLDLFEPLARGGVVAYDGAAAPQGDPQVAVGVDRHAVGRS